MSASTKWLLASEILKDGFCSNAEPVLFTEYQSLMPSSGDAPACSLNGPWCPPNVAQVGFPRHSIGYFKGRTRVQLLLTILSVAKDRGMDMAVAWFLELQIWSEVHQCQC